MQLRRSERVIRKLTRHVLLGESYQAIVVDSKKDSISYNEALEDIDTQEWHMP